MAYTERKQRPNHLGAALRAARKQAAQEQVPLSEAMGYSYNVVMTWENGGKRLYVDEWARLCVLLPALDPALGETHTGELNHKAPGTEARATGSRPSRLDPAVADVLRRLVERQPALSVADHAEAAGLDYIPFWSMTKGRATPTTAQLRTLAAYFAVDVDQLLGLRPLEAPTYAALQDLVVRKRKLLDAQAEQLQDLERIREMNDLLRGKAGRKAG